MKINFALDNDGSLNIECLNKDNDCWLSINSDSYTQDFLFFTGCPLFLVVVFTLNYVVNRPFFQILPSWFCFDYMPECYIYIGFLKWNFFRYLNIME